MDFIKIGIISIAAALIAINFKGIKSEYGILVSIGASLLIFFYGISKLSVVVNSIKFIADTINIEGTYITLIFKIIGITYISEIASDISRDCGYATLGNQIQIFGKITILGFCMPVLTAIVKSIIEMING
jgi:stage III sporulation protein AD